VLGAAAGSEPESIALALRGSSDGLWDWDLRTGELFLSDEWLAMLGWQDPERRWHADDWLDCIHPDDRERFEREITAHLDGNAPRVDSEHRVLSGRGDFIWVRVRGLADRDAEGRPRRIAGSQTDITESRQRDALTGLANRLRFAERVAAELERPDAAFGVLVIEVDRFAAVAEAFSQPLADKLVLASARRLADALRPGDELARLGGARFAVLLDDLREERDAERVADRLRAALSAPLRLGDADLIPTASIGVAHRAVPGDGPDELLRTGHLALRRAQRGGGDRSEHFVEAMREPSRTRVQIESELRRALESESFVVHYQPIVALSDARVTGFEGLVRWSHRERGLVPPNLFIPVSEETGLIVPLGRFVLREACRQMQAWGELHPPARDLIVSVNVSGRELDEPDLADRVLATIDHIGLDPSRLKLEITETAIMRSPGSASSALCRLKDRGIRLALDDFGTGYSSLAMLHRLPFDTIKIDRSFVMKLGAPGQGGEIVQTIVGLAERLGMEVVAEGVETEDQRQILQQLGCGLAQGYWFGRPVAAGEAEGFLLRAAS
jgi:diguanylate cyclase (GGDEF)-like protein/PAS domain S-box-containing protein